MCVLKCIAEGLEELAELIRPKTTVRWTIGPVSESTGVGKHSPEVLTRTRRKKADVMLILKDTEQAILNGGFLDKKGQPATVDGVPVWAVSDATILSVQPAADGKSATIVANGPLGLSQVSITGDADLGEGMKPVVGTLDVTVVSGEAVSASINAGTPTEQP